MPDLLRTIADSTPAARLRTLACLFVLACLLSLVACEAAEPPLAGGTRAGTTAAPETSYRARPGYVVDSILPVEEELRRFRAGLGAPPERLGGGAPSRERLVRRFAEALGKADTAALAGMALTPTEFAYLVYPSSPYTRPPYRQSPEIVWMQLQSASSSGLRRLLDRAREYQYLDHRCPATPEREELNRLWRQCVTRVVRAPGDTAEVRLFGVIVEREGQFKFASYESDF